MAEAGKFVFRLVSAVIVIALALDPVHDGRLPLPVDLMLRGYLLLVGLWLSAPLIRPFVQRRRSRSW